METIATFALVISVFSLFVYAMLVPYFSAMIERFVNRRKLKERNCLQIMKDILDREKSGKFFHPGRYTWEETEISILELLERCGYVRTIVRWIEDEPQISAYFTLGGRERAKREKAGENAAKK